MMKDRIQLTVINNGNNVVPNVTCYAAHSMCNVSCQRQMCPNWINDGESNNCAIIAAHNGPHTLQKIGKIFGLTRMRICQIEKNILEKIRKLL